MKGNLKKYNSKRDFNKTKEPVGKKIKNGRKLHFIIQHHLARKDHYDFRIEWDGVLKSWAVPKGPSYNRKDKRLSILVEDHPLSYRHFEGTIPKGLYGGGTVMLFDVGFWEPLSNVDEGFEKGILKFALYGKRVYGKWALVHIKDENWLLIKENDNVYGYKDIKNYNRSIKTGRTMVEIENNDKKVQNVFESVLITNPQKKILSKVSKLEIVKYYDAVKLRMLPFLQDRLISTIRCPDGVKENAFYKKHFDENKGLGKLKVGKEVYYYVMDNYGFIEEVQMNGFEFHIWGSLKTKINYPDMMVFDLDPDEGLSLDKVRDGVRDLKSILDELHLVSFLKTSGGKGYHVVVPFTSIKSWSKFRSIALNIGLLMERRWPEKYTSTMSKAKRKNKIFIDWMRNIKGATSVAPYSLRLRKNVTVSMPIKWSELDKIKPDEITIDKAIKRLNNKDPWEKFFYIEQ